MAGVAETAASDVILPVHESVTSIAVEHGEKNNVQVTISIHKEKSKSMPIFLSTVQ